MSKADISDMLAAGRLHERTPRESELTQLADTLKRRLGDGAPVFLMPEPVAGATPKNCWLNVKEFLEASGGERYPGWLVGCQSDMYYLKCIPHIVVRLGERLLDVTPPEREGQILFVPDSSVTVKTKGRIIGLSKKAKARRVIAAAAKIAAFGDTRLRQHNDNAEAEYADLSIDDLPYDANRLMERGGRAE